MAQNFKSLRNAKGCLRTTDTNRSPSLTLGRLNSCTSKQLMTLPSQSPKMWFSYRPPILHWLTIVKHNGMDSHSEDLMALPQTKANSLHDRIFAAVERGTPITQIEIKSFERDISDIKKVNRALGFMLEGILYAVLKNEPASITAHKQSIAAAPHHADIRRNYGVSLKRFLRYEEAFEQFCIAFDFSPRSLSALEAMLHTLLIIGRLDKLPYIVSECKNKSADLNFEELPVMKSATIYAENIEHLNISQREIQTVSLKVAEIARRRNIELSYFTQRLGSFGDRGILNVAYEVETDGETLFAMNEELHDFIAEDLTLESWDKLSFSFRSFVDDEGSSKESDHVG